MQQYKAEQGTLSVKFMETVGTVCGRLQEMTGWNRLKMPSARVTDVYDLEYKDPAKARTAPTALKNKKFPSFLYHQICTPLPKLEPSIPHQCPHRGFG